ncbi:MAG: MFS transporter [Dehalococcoidia bacterium]|nr:MFS transporter [Dehalococcoidia bacterium]
MLELTDRAGLGGLVGFTLGIPAFFITLPAGVWADQLDRKKMVFFTAIGGGAVMATVAVLAVTGILNTWLALVLALGAGLAGAAVQPPLMSIVPMIVARERLMNGIVLRTMGMNLAQVFGAGLAGAFIAIAGFEGAFAAQALFYVIAALMIARVKLEDPPERQPERPRMRAQAIEGLRFVFDNPGLRGLVSISVVAGLFMLGPIFVLVPEIARTKLEVGATMNGLLMTFTGAGMFVTSFFLASRSTLSRKGTWFIANFLVAGPIVMAIGLSPIYPLTALAMFAWGVGGGVFINMNQTLVQLYTPDAMMGRVMSIYMLSIAGLLPLGSLVAGAGAEVIGADTYLVLSGVIMLACAVYSWLRLKELRAMD